MGLRFRKSVKILPGVRINCNLHSTSISFGGKGFRTTYSSTGRVTRSVGIPGTGLSYVTSNTPHRQRDNNRRNNYQARIDTSSERGIITENHGRPTTVPTAPSAPSVPTTDLNQIRSTIENIFRYADTLLDWRQILISQDDFGVPNWEYFKARAEAVLDGDIDTYFEIITDVNPVDDLLAYGSEFECSTDDPRMMLISFQVNSAAVLGDVIHISSRVFNDLLQDYVCGCAIRIARDMFALLPLRRVIVNALDRGQGILSVDFDRAAFERIDFSKADASDTVSLFNCRMSFSIENGFSPIELF